MSYLTPSRFGGFLLHRSWFRSGLSTRARAVLSTGCNAVSPRQYIHRADDIGIVLVATVHTLKLGLRLPVLCGNVPAGRTSLAGVVCRHGNKQPACPSHFVFQLAAKFTPSLVKDGLVESRLLLDPLAVLCTAAFGRPGHIADLQTLNNDHRVVFADRSRGFVQEVFAGVCNIAVNSLNLPFGFAPVAAELDFAAHAPLVAFEPGLMPPCLCA